MGGRSSTQSSSNQLYETTNVDARSVLDNGAVQATGGSVVNVNRLDAPLVGASLYVADQGLDTANNALFWNAYTSSLAGQTAGRALDSVDSTVGMATAQNLVGLGAVRDAMGWSIDSANQSNRRVTDLVDSVIGRQADLAYGSQQGAYDMATGVAGSAIDGLVNTTAGALGLAGDSFSASKDLAAFGVQKGIDLSALTIDKSLGTVGKSIDAVYGSMQGAKDLVYGTTQTAFGQVADVIDKAFSLVNTSQSRADAAYRDAGQMLGGAYADSQGRGALTDKILMAAIIGSVVIAALAVRK